MNKKNAVMILPAVIIFTAGVTLMICADIHRKIMEQCLKRQQLRREEIKELLLSVESILTNTDVKDFEMFSDYLDEYYNIQVKIVQNYEVVYSSPKFNSPISCYEMSKYDLNDLIIHFEDNKKKTGLSKSGFIFGGAGYGRGIHPWDNLKKCPQCGDYPWLVGKDGKDFYSGFPYRVICSNHNCDCHSMQSDNFELCIDDWNEKVK